MVGCGVSIFAVCAAAAASIGLSWLKRRMRDVHAASRTRRVPSGMSSGKSVERTVEKPVEKVVEKAAGKGNGNSLYIELNLSCTRSPQK